MKTNLPLSNYHQSQENEAGEFLLINRLIKHLAQPPFCQSEDGQNKEAHIEKDKGLQGIGDDCAVIPSSMVGKYLLTSVDSFIEGRHFLLTLSTPEEIGFKAAATAVSDIAAMGGKPRFILINLHLPPNFESLIVEKIYRGIQEFCSKFGVFVIGGNTSSAAETSISVTVIGECATQPLLRSGAKESDDFWVSGALGLSQLGLSTLKDKREYSVAESVLQSALSRYQRPEPRILLGEKLLALGATSAIDISDGIFQDAGHIAAASGVDIELDLESLNLVGVSEGELVELLAGGGDYELLFSAPRELRETIEGFNLDTPLDCRIVRCGTATKTSSEALIHIKTKGGVISSAELAKQYNLSGLGNDHFIKKIDAV